MALYQPGKRSNITFLVSATFSIILLIILIAGHLLIIANFWFYFTKGTGMDFISTYTGLSEVLLWLSVAAAFAMDIWVVINMRKGHQKAKRR